MSAGSDDPDGSGDGNGNRGGDVEEGRENRRHARSGSSPRSRYEVLGYYLMVPGLIALDWVVFRYLLGIDYFAWYLSNGAVIALGTAFVSRMWESVESLGRPLVSAHPLRYYGTCLQLVGLSLLVTGSAAKPPTVDRRPFYSVDMIVHIPVMLAVAGLVIAWLLFVAPLNYLVTLVSGAPAREYLRHPDRRAIGLLGWEFRGREAVASLDVEGFRTLHIYETGTQAHAKLNRTEREGLEKARERDEDSVVDLSFGRNPFATTQALTGLVVFVLARFV